MYKNDLNAIKRARNSAGITQEKLAEMSGYSVESIKAWENGGRGASIEVLDMLALCLAAPWLPGIYLREQSAGGILDDVIPSFAPGMSLSQAVLQLINRIYAFADKHSDRRLVSIAADNIISEEERPDFDAILEELRDIVSAAAALRYSNGGDGAGQ